MSAKDLISKWEDALAQVLSAWDEGRELSDEDLEQVSAVAGVALRSQLRAGGGGDDDWDPDATGYMSCSCGVG